MLEIDLLRMLEEFFKIDVGFFLIFGLIVVFLLSFIRFTSMGIGFIRTFDFIGDCFILHFSPVLRSFDPLITSGDCCDDEFILFRKLSSKFFTPCSFLDFSCYIFFFSAFWSSNSFFFCFLIFLALDFLEWKELSKD